MVLKLDQEFAAAMAPIMQGMAGMARPKVHDISGRRARYAAIEGIVPQIPDSVAFERLKIAQPDGSELQVYHYKQRSQKAPTPAVLHFHGGGFITCTPDINVERLASLVSKVDVQVFSVDYRLAPEHPYPAALDDAWSALSWLYESAQSLGIDKTRVAVMGESAGGGLAAALAIRARDSKLSPPIAYQLLGSPMLDDRTLGDVPGDFKLWDADDNITGRTAYLGEKPGGQGVPATAAPARLEDFTGLPSLYLDTSQFDLFSRENHDYARKFLEAGIEVEYHMFPGLPHGYDGLYPTHRVTLQSEANKIRILRTM